MINIQIKANVLILVLSILTMSFCLVSPAKSDVLPSGWYLQNATPVSISESNKHLQTRRELMLEEKQEQLNSVNGIQIEQTLLQTVDPEIEELARGLFNDPLRIFNYVRNQIDYVPYFGYLKGAKGTLLDLSGNDFDQAALLKALLIASGFQAEFAYGKMNMLSNNGIDNQDLAGWFGVEKDLQIIGDIAGSAGIPITGRSNFVNDVRRVWVKATINGTIHHLDPAFKVYDRTPSIDIKQTIGYNEQDLKIAANATINNDWIQNIDDGEIRSKLSEYTNNLLAHLKTNHPNDEITNVVGSKKFRKVVYDTLPLHPNFGYTVDELWSEIPLQFNHTLTIRHGELDETFNIPEIINKKLSISYKEITLPPPPQPFQCFNGSGTLDTWDMGSVTSVFQTGNIKNNFDCTITNTSSNLTLGVFMGVPIGTTDTFYILRPDGVRSFGENYFIPPGQSQAIRMEFNGGGLTPGLKTSTLTIAYRFQANGYNLVERTTQIRGHVIAYPEATLSIDDVKYKTEPLPQNPVVDIDTLFLKVDHPYAENNGSFADQETAYQLRRGGNYVLINEYSNRGAEVSLKAAQNKLAFLAETEPQGSKKLITETLNVMGKSWARLALMNTFLEADLADVSVNLHHYSGIMAQEEGFFVDVKGAATWQVENTPTVSRYPIFRAGALVGSAAEHGMIQQQQIDFDAASTIKMLLKNNANSDKTYLASGINWALIKDDVNYSPAQKSSFQSYLNSDVNARIVLPENGNILLDQWSGAGFISYLPANPNSVGMRMTIEGNLTSSQSSTDKSTSNVFAHAALVDPEINRLRGEQSRVHGGGFSTIPGEVDPFKPTFNANNEFSPVSQTPIYNVIDPVDIATGDYLYDLPLLSFGNAEPWGLGLTASYSSRENRSDYGMGYGWVHSYDISLREYTDVALSLGGRTAFDAAPAIVASVIMADLLENDQPSLEEWMLATSTANWQMDHITDKAVAIKQGRQNMTFVEMPDGEYISPPGSTQILSKVNDQYVVNNRFGGGLNFNSDNKVNSITDVDGNGITFTYQNDLLDQVTDTTGRALTFAYTNDKLQSVTDFTSRSVTFNYVENELETFTDVMTNDVVFTYDADHRIDTVTNQLGIEIVDNVYDSQGRVIKQFFPIQSGTVSNEIYYSGAVNAERDTDGYLRFHYFDKKKRRIGLENALGELNQMVFDGQNHVVKTIDPTGVETSQEYDENQNLKWVINGAGEKTSYFYDTNLRLDYTEDDLGNRIKYHYDAENHLVGNTTYPKQGDTIDTNMSHYPNGQVFTTTDGRNNVTTLTYDTYGHISTKTTGSHASLTTDFDNLGRLDIFTPPVGDVTDFDYNNRSQITFITDPLNKQTIYGYDDLGNRNSHTDRNNKITTTTYTPNELVDTITFDDNSQKIHTYDNRDNVQTLTDWLGTTTYGYNEVNRLTSKTDPNGFVVGYDHYANGLLKTITYPGNKVVTYEYDEANRIKKVITWLNEEIVYHYDQAGRLDYIDNANGTKTEFEYDGANRLTDLFNKKSNGEIISQQNFILDENGNREKITSTQPQAPVESNQNITYTYNPQRNRLTKIDGGTVNILSYDDEGQTQSNGSDNYTFNLRYRLSQYNNSSFDYDSEGHRLKTTRNGIVTYYIYDEGNNLLAEADGNKQITKYFIHGASINHMIENGQSYTYHFDAIGSTLAMTDQSQTIINQYAYSPYGRILGVTETKPQPFTFAGQFGIQTEENNIYYMRARYYDANLGRFINEDPIGFDGGINLYGYAASNPLNALDPSGLRTWGLTINANFGWGAGGTAGYNVVVDDQWNWAVQSVVGAGGDTPGVSLMLNYETTNAESVHHLTGAGGQIIVDAGEGIMVEGGTMNGPGFSGEVLGVGVGAGTPVGVAGSITNTRTITSGNFLSSNSGRNVSSTRK